MPWLTDWESVDYLFIGWTFTLMWHLTTCFGFRKLHVEQKTRTILSALYNPIIAVSKPLALTEVSWRLSALPLQTKQKTNLKTSLRKINSSINESESLRMIVRVVLRATCVILPLQTIWSSLRCLHGRLLRRILKHWRQNKNWKQLHWESHATACLHDRKPNKLNKPKRKIKNKKLWVKIFSARMSSE